MFYDGRHVGTDLAAKIVLSMATCTGSHKHLTSTIYIGAKFERLSIRNNNVLTLRAIAGLE